LQTQMWVARNEIPGMDAQRRQESQRRTERQGSSLCEGTRHEPEASAARGRQTPRLFLRPDGRDESQVDRREDEKRPEFSHQ